MLYVVKMEVMKKRGSMFVGKDMVGYRFVRVDKSAI